ncbi:transposase [Kovacikia minuta CCNUW1]|uniref:transposase n=1 Tax=Kovacikia minuta TaxID=2931930 RepID=UPI001CCAE074|nr:transposase [Kovacikia minuta]UBF23688.1 transposase [Kovacikia minuta CCNUW1]
MKYNPDKHHRRSIRLQGYDYASAGMYFVAICTYQRQCLFGAVVDGEMQLNDDGRMVSDEWIRSRNIRQEIDFDAWVIMPNHIHGIVVIYPPNLSQHSVGAHGRAPLQNVAPQRFGIAYRKPRSLSSFIAGFKSAATKQINMMRNAPGTPVWQRNYYEHIVRNEESLQHLRQYIHNNPLSWQEDQLHPDNPSKW